MDPLPPRVAVAVSGGRDSTALLHCAVRMAAPLGVQVTALHVHHGLMPQADAWLAQVRTQARRWGAAFDARQLAGRPAPGDSVEAWARRERYAALAAMARAAACPLVLLAHHRRDQAETWLLQALRGAGPAGLAAMPAVAEREGIVWARPWLDQPRGAIEAYVRRHRLRHVDDASNDDPRMARNRLRLQVWPALGAAFPDAEVALAASSRRAYEARALAQEVAALDLPGVCEGNALVVAPWQGLPPARRRNALQAWLQAVLEDPLPQALVDRLLVELPACKAGRWPGGRLQLRLHWGQLRAEPAADVDGRPAAGHAPEVPVELRCPGLAHIAGWHGQLRVLEGAEGGAPKPLLHHLLARPRQGGERFRLAPAGLPRSLKKQYQAAGVPAWQRDGPLLYLPDGRLLFVPGLGIEASLRAAPGEPQLLLEWQPGPPGSRQSTG